MVFNERRRVRLFLSLILLLLPLAIAGPAPSRVVAIGDVHGAYTEFVTILQKTGLIDSRLHWSGGSATFVQTGDIIDRGTGTRACLDLVMALERQASKKSGHVIPLLGNHEAMNAMGDVRYVTPEIYKTFSTARSEKLRGQALQDYLQFLATHAGHSHSLAMTNDDAGRAKWMAAHPPGYFEYRDEFGPRGRYGRWIRTHHALVEVGEGVFVHGGLNPTLKFSGIGDLDNQVHSELAEFDSLWQSLAEKKVIWRYMTLSEAVKQANEELSWIQSQGKADPDTVRQLQKLSGYKNWMVASSDGPLWYRGLAQDPEEKLMSSFLPMLSRLKARFVVDGHTVVSKSDILQRFANHVFLIDTGMLKEEYSGHASALEIVGGKFTAFYSDSSAKALAAPGIGSRETP